MQCDMACKEYSVSKDDGNLHSKGDLTWQIVSVHGDGWILPFLSDFGDSIKMSGPDYLKDQATKNVLELSS